LSRNKRTANINWITIGIYLTIIILISLIIYGLLFLNFPPSPNGTSNTDWLQFWGSYIGGVIGGMTTLGGVYYTLKHQDNDKDDNEDFQSEMKRLEVIPCLDNQSLEDHSFSRDYNLPSGYLIFYDSTMDNRFTEGVCFINRIETQFMDQIIDVFKLKITNIGLGPCIGVKIDFYRDDKLILENIQPQFGMAVGASNIIALTFIEYPIGKYKLVFTTNDVYMKNSYKQELEFEYMSRYNEDNNEDEYGVAVNAITKPS